MGCPAQGRKATLRNAGPGPYASCGRGIHGLTWSDSMLKRLLERNLRESEWYDS